MDAHSHQTPAGPHSGEAPPLVFGVLGGIASGKSAVGRLLAGPEGVVLDADRFAREALESESGRARLVADFGPEILDADGQPDRAAIAEQVFASPDARRRLEGWIHPQVRARILAGLEEARRNARPRVVLDVPLLLENDDRHDFLRHCDVLVFVEAPDDEREARAVANRGWTPGEVARREATQMPLHEKRERAHHVLRNHGSLAELETAVIRLLKDLGR